MLDHGGQRHVEGPSQITHGGGATAEALDQVPPRRVAEGPEDVVDGVILKHLLKY